MSPLNSHIPTGYSFWAGLTLLVMISSPTSHDTSIADVFQDSIQIRLNSTLILSSGSIVPEQEFGDFFSPDLQSNSDKLDEP